MTADDVRDELAVEPLLAQHRAALFELRENLARLKYLVDRDENEVLGRFESFEGPALEPR
jgi:hypothetical protein